MLSVYFYNDPAPTQIYTLSLHDALPISLLADRPPEEIARLLHELPSDDAAAIVGYLPDMLSGAVRELIERRPDRKSTRLNSSHRTISYAVFCLKKKKNY